MLKWQSYWPSISLPLRANVSVDIVDILGSQISILYRYRQRRYRPITINYISAVVVVVVVIIINNISIITIIVIVAIIVLL